jgi:hypothetical protein
MPLVYSIFFFSFFFFWLEAHEMNIWMGYVLVFGKIDPITFFSGVVMMAGDMKQ